VNRIAVDQDHVTVKAYIFAQFSIKPIHTVRSGGGTKIIDKQNKTTPPAYCLFFFKLEGFQQAFY